MRESSLRERGCSASDSEYKISRLRESVLKWFRANGRCFPWRQTSDPFHILLAESLLRQTQATRLAEPYLELTSKYPDAHALANANVDELRSWFKPFGLVKRADRLVKAAHMLVESYGGRVPKDPKALAALPGMGIYSTRAVLCLGFGEPYPMVDEGSGRVLRRTLDLAPKGPAYSDSRLLQIAEVILPKASCREFNLGLIDIAAIYCHVKTPECVPCPLLDVCGHGQRIAMISR